MATRCPCTCVRWTLRHTWLCKRRPKASEASRTDLSRLRFPVCALSRTLSRTSVSLVPLVGRPSKRGRTASTVVAAATMARSRGAGTDVPAFDPACTAEDVESLASAIKATFVSRLEAIESISKEDVTFENTCGALAAALGEAAEDSANVTFPSMVHQDQQVRATSMKAKDSLKNLFDLTFTRAKLFQLVEEGQRHATSSGQERLARYFITEFGRKGLSLAEEQRTLLMAKMAEIEQLCSQFCANINEDNSGCDFKEEELVGLPADFIGSLDRDSDGKFHVGLRAPHLLPVSQYATRQETRKALLEAKAKQCQQINGPILERVLSLRQECAELLGYKNHAEYMLAPKMAARPGSVRDFHRGILEACGGVRAGDLDALGKIKSQLYETPEKMVNPWDTAYLSRLHKEDLGVDENVIRQYFPMEHVISTVLDIYEELLCLSFRKLDNFIAWHPSVEAYAVVERSSDGVESTRGHFFLDLYPREGKYAHQCVYPLRPSYVRACGEQVTPACAIIGNLTKGVDGKPSLMRMREVEVATIQRFRTMTLLRSHCMTVVQTFFHEFGHVMHCVCSQVDYVPFAWAWSAVPWPGGVQQDFLEVPSMMLENFVYQPTLLKRLSKHHSTAEELPDDIIQKIVQARHVLSGYHYSRMIFLGEYDIIVHSGPAPYSYEGQEGLSAQQLYAIMCKHLTGVACIEGTFPAASWFHLCMGYDAGYFGYLWSEVFAADLFAKFVVEDGDGVKEGRINEELGKRYRDTILTPCASEDGYTMLRNFLDREPSAAAFREARGMA
eukprot:scaffold3540_cov379-Prasinococcus_capsulatus_cf.AAC.2